MGIWLEDYIHKLDVWNNTWCLTRTKNGPHNPYGKAMWEELALPQVRNPQSTEIVAVLFARTMLGESE
eukprot:2699103-Prorocentrum_lima.AAC.1